MMLGNGIKKNLDVSHGVKKDKQGWRYTFEENLPYKPKDMLVFNMPPNDEETPKSTPEENANRQSTLKSEMSLRIKSQGSSLSRKLHNKMKAWMHEYKNATFTYAGYLKPGKH